MSLESLLSGQIVNSKYLLCESLGGGGNGIVFRSEKVLKMLMGRPVSIEQEIMDWLAATVRGWNAAPTPFCWGGKRWQRRQRFRERHPLGGSGAYTRPPIRRKWQPSEQIGRVCSLT